MNTLKSNFADDTDGDFMYILFKAQGTEDPNYSKDVVLLRMKASKFGKLIEIHQFLDCFEGNKRTQHTITLYDGTTYDYWIENATDLAEEERKQKYQILTKEYEKIVALKNKLIGNNFIPLPPKGNIRFGVFCRLINFDEHNRYGLETNASVRKLLPNNTSKNDLDFLTHFDNSYYYDHPSYFSDLRILRNVAVSSKRVVYFRVMLPDVEENSIHGSWRQVKIDGSHADISPFGERVVFAGVSYANSEHFDTGIYHYDQPFEFHLEYCVPVNHQKFPHESIPMSPKILVQVIEYDSWGRYQLIGVGNSTIDLRSGSYLPLRNSISNCQPSGCSEIEIRLWRPHLSVVDALKRDMIGGVYNLMDLFFTIANPDGRLPKNRSEIIAKSDVGVVRFSVQTNIYTQIEKPSNINEAKAFISKSPVRNKHSMLNAMEVYNLSTKANQKQNTDKNIGASISQIGPSIIPSVQNLPSRYGMSMPTDTRGVQQQYEIERNEEDDIRPKPFGNTSIGLRRRG